MLFSAGFAGLGWLNSKLAAIDILPLLGMEVVAG